MTSVKYADTGSVDLVAAITTIRNYFEEKQSPGLGEKHVAIFVSEMNRQENLVQKHPFTYRVRDDGFFRSAAKEFRSFIAHWFTVFYSYEEKDNEVVIWFIRSSKSDFSNIVSMNQSRS